VKDFGLSRNVPVKRGATALLCIDVQNYSVEAANMRTSRWRRRSDAMGTSSARCESGRCPI